MRRVILGAGHSNVKGQDQGAAGHGYIEGHLSVEFRDLLTTELRALNTTVITDHNSNILSAAIKYFKNLLTSTDIGIDIHWNAADNPKATGTEVLVPYDASAFEIRLAHDIAACIASTLSIPQRGSHAGVTGVKTELTSHHGRLGWMRLSFENLLIEMCFISNSSDMIKYQLYKTQLAKKLAVIIYNAANNNTTNIIAQPAQTNKKNIYIVVKGDSLSKIARAHNTTVESIIRKNSLKTSILQIGQQLAI